MSRNSMLPRKELLLPFSINLLTFVIVQALNYWTSYSAGLDLIGGTMKIVAHGYGAAVILFSIGAFTEAFLVEAPDHDQGVGRLISGMAWFLITIFDNMLTYWTYAVLIEENLIRTPESLGAFVYLFPFAMAIVQAALEFASLSRLSKYIGSGIMGKSLKMLFENTGRRSMSPAPKQQKSNNNRGRQPQQSRPTPKPELTKNRNNSGYNRRVAEQLASAMDKRRREPIDSFEF